MDSLEVNKVCAAVLVAGIAFMLPGFFAETLVHVEPLKQTAIKIEGAATSGAAPQADPPIAALLASADPKHGQVLTQQLGCVACHTFVEGGKAGIGPNLYGVVGDPHGHMAGYDYSSALKSKQGPWTFAELNEWLKKPSAYAPGTKMTFAGISNAQQRADVIDYLHTLSQHPEPLPPPPAAGTTTGSAGGTPQTFDQMLATADPKAGQADMAKLGCVACHTVNEGGKAGVGPNLYGVVGAPHGHMAGFDYSAGMKAKQGPWTYDELNQWLTKPSAYVPGTKMTFAGVADQKMRADIIDFLHTLSHDPEPLPGASGAPAAPAAAAGVPGAAPTNAPSAGGSDNPTQNTPPTGIQSRSP